MSTAKLAGILLLFALVGAPLIGFAWGALNDLLSGRIDPTQLLLTVPVVAVLALLLWYLARSVERWYAERNA